MFQRYSAIVILASLTSTIVWWSNPAPLSTPASKNVFASEDAATHDLTSERKELLEELRFLVLSQHRYRAKHGSFTRILAKLDYSIPKSLSERYGIEVQSSGSDQLSIAAFSEKDGKIADRAAINHDFDISSNFPISREELAVLRREGQQQLSAWAATIDKRDRRLAQNDSSEPEKQLLSDLIKRMPSRNALHPGQRSEAELVIEPIEGI